MTAAETVETGILKMTLELPCEVTWTPLARALTGFLFQTLGISSRDVDAGRVIVAELCNNVVAHAGLARGSWYRVEIEHFGTQVEISVTDHGVGFDPEAVPAPKPGQEGGWGLHLVRSLAEWVDILPVQGGGTRVRVRLPVGHQPAPRGDDARATE